VLCTGSYTLTSLGHDAREALRSVTEWSQRWAAELADAPPTAAEDAGDSQRNRF
jgi:DNA-binding HxlR family transcriptional regulator